MFHATDVSAVRHAAALSTSLRLPFWLLLQAVIACALDALDSAPAPHDTAVAASATTAQSAIHFTDFINSRFPFVSESRDYLMLGAARKKRAA